MKEKIIFEKRNPVLNFFRVPIIFLLGILPKNWCKKFFLLYKGQGVETCVSYAKRFKALEVLYTFDKNNAKRNDRFWGTFLDNSLALRNRLRLVKQQIKKAIGEISKRKDKIFVLSLASGSGRSIIEVVSELEKNIRNKVFVRFVDFDPEALEYIKTLAKSYGLNEGLEWIRCSVFNPKTFYGNFRPDIVEIVGILDYLHDEKALELITLVHQNLFSGGWLIVCNVVPNVERRFISKALDWSMVYRTPKELEKIVRMCGFEKLNMIIEPLGIHVMCVAQKI